MIKINKVTKEYVAGIKAVNELDLTIKDGEIFGFIGPNGSGKTTTLKMITGITSITDGSIEINNFDITKNPLEAKKQFGFVSDDADIFLRLKGIEYLNFIGDIYDVPSDIRQETIEKYTRKFEIYNVLNDKIDSYSHGMRQKIVIIGALLHNPDNWILDEPLTGLDPQSSYILKEMMKEHAAKGKSVIFSTHVLEVAEKLVDRIGIIRKGKLIFVGTLEQLKKNRKSDQTLESIFLEMTTDE